MELAMNHPNQYFEESQNLLSGNTKPLTIKLERNNVNTYSQNDTIKSEILTEDLENIVMDVDF